MFRSWRQHIGKALGALMALLLVIIILGYTFNWSWTGLRGKTLWDWLQLLIIPVLLTLGAIWYTARQNHDREIALDNQREVVFQTYLDKMSELLLEKNLRGSKEEDEVRKIAHVRTLAVLSNLDNRRKGNVLQFLHESDLINKNTPIIRLLGADLRGADLSKAFHIAFPWVVHQDIVDTVEWGAATQFGADLISTNLRGANLSRACLYDSDLRGADLRDANLHDADLIGAWLRDANLRGADLSEAHLQDSDLSEAWLRDTNLRGAWLRGADLRGADLSEAQLKQIKSLKGTIMPDGSVHP